MPAGFAARVTDLAAHGTPLSPGPGSVNVLTGGLPQWRGVPAAAAAALSSAKATSDATIQTAEATTLAAAGTPAAPAAVAAEQAVKSAAASAMGSMMTGMAGGADIHVCPIPLPLPPHGPGVVINGSPTVLVNALPACRMGDTILEAVGPPDQIAIGCPTVIIGDGNAAVARVLTVVGGSGTPADADLVAAELAKMPISVLLQMQANGTKVVACEGPITDYRTDLKGVHPRGWPPGATWDSVPGVFTPDRNEVVIGVIGQGTAAGAHVPKTGEGHGSANLTVHESMHSVDHGSGNPSASGDFNAARSADQGSLSGYENQPGAAGQQESYAESAARHAEGQDSGTPALQKYWDQRW
ncbi:MAG TPA: PAAR domain-containing protein [Hyphomicrobiales bacterium]|nr:PAAR domain-containing protein [Hyphomicrobiales bacterium]